jgi:hypothetical protein
MFRRRVEHFAKRTLKFYLLPNIVNIRPAANHASPLGDENGVIPKEQYFSTVIEFVEAWLLRKRKANSC